VKDVQSDDCFDANTLAAWADGTVDRKTKARIEAHAADCAWCQALLAAMVRTEPPVETAPAWSWRTLAWLVPVTSAAAALLVWTIVPKQPTPIERNEKPAAGQIAAAPPFTPVTRAEPPAPAPAPTKETPRDAKRDQVKDALKSVVPSAAERNALAKPEARTPAETAPTTAANESVQLSPPPPAGAGGTLDSARRASPNLAPAAPAPQAQSAAAAKAFAVTVAGATPAKVIVSPNPASRWRIVSGGVEHSADGGSTWEPQQTGSTVTLTAGSAPSSSVCWLVGPGGAVLLSTDGGTWRRVTFPESADLIAVSATDDKTATVTLAGGQTRRTTDAGLTWQP
jgi:Putative zinc-finger